MEGHKGGKDAPAFLKAKGSVRRLALSAELTKVKTAPAIDSQLMGSTRGEFREGKEAG